MSGMANGIGQETDQWGVGRMSRDLVRALPVPSFGGGGGGKI